MAGTAENPKIGLSDVYIARLLSDDGTGAPSYDTPIALLGAIQASVNPNSSVETDYADNGAFFVTGNRANTEMSLEFTNVDPATLALMLGQTRVNGITLETPLDQAPYFALGFKVWIGGLDSNGEKIYEYFWYAKGKFSAPETGGTTKGENVEFQHVSLTAMFIPTQYKYDGNSGVICSHARSDIDTSSDVISNWFNAPVVSPSIDTSELTVAIAQGSSTKKITITGSKDSGSTCTIAKATANDDNIIITSSGVVVDGTFTVSGGIVTFTSDEAMSGDVIVTVTSGLKDVYGVGATPTTDTVTIS